MYGLPVSDSNRTSTSTAERAGSVTYVLVMRYLPLVAVSIWRYTSARGSTSSVRLVVEESSRSVNVAPSDTTNWVSRVPSVSMRG